MGIDAKLYINSKYGVADVVKILENTPGVGKITPHYREDHAFLMFKFEEEDRQMMVFRTCNQGPDCTVVSLGQWGSATILLTKIATIVGGFLNAMDCGDHALMFQNPHEGFSEFVLKHQILIHGLTAKDADQLCGKVAKAIGYDRGETQFNPETLQDEIVKKP